MHSPVAPAVLVAALAVLAGCGGIAVNPSTETATPAPVPADPTLGAGYPPGTGPNGVDEPLVLAEAHYDALQGEPYAVHRTRTVRAADGSLVERTDLRARFSGDRSRFHVRYVAEGLGVETFEATPSRLVLWSDGDVLLRSVTRGGETRRRAYPPEAFSRRPFGDWPSEFLGLHSPDREALGLFRAFEGSVMPVADDGSTVYRVNDTRLADPGVLAALDGVDDPHDATLTATITRTGLVRAYRVAYDATVDGRPVRVERTVRYSEVGTATIDRPPWYHEVVNGTAATQSSDGTPSAQSSDGTLTGRSSDETATLRRNVPGSERG